MLPTPVSYFGGKTHLRDFILPHIENSGTIYVEPFCGSANIFWAKQPHEVEVLNDLNGDIINFFRVLQNRRLFRHFVHLTRWTPYSIEEFGKALDILNRQPIADGLSIPRAWAFFVRGLMAYSGKLTAGKNEWRRSYQAPGVIEHWRSRQARLEQWAERLRAAQIENKPALDIITYWDGPEVTFYLDPPYVEDTRDQGSLEMYKFEMTDFDHEALVQTLLTVRGRVVMSGYVTPLYEPLERAGWRRYDRTLISPMAGAASGSPRHERTECLWVNRPGLHGDIWMTGGETDTPLPKPKAEPSLFDLL